MSTMDRSAWNENEDYGGSIIDEDDAIAAVGGGGGDNEEARTLRGASVQEAEAGAPSTKRTNGAVEASNGAEREAKRPRHHLNKGAEEGAVKVLADRTLRFVTSSPGSRRRRRPSEQSYNSFKRSATLQVSKKRGTFCGEDASSAKPSAAAATALGRAEQARLPGPSRTGPPKRFVPPRVPPDDRPVEP